MKDSHESAMHVNEDSVSRRLGATNKTFLYFIIATLVALLVFALATIMVLVIRRTAADPATEGSTERIRKETQLMSPNKRFEHTHIKLADINERNTSEDYLRILQNVPAKGAAAYMRVSNSVNRSKLSLTDNGVCDNIQCKSEELVIRKQGLYLIYCHLNFHFANCSHSPTDLKIELLINNEVNRQTLSTWCASDSCQEKNFKTLFQLHLTYLKEKDRISLTLSHPKFLNEIHLPNDNVLGVLRYSSEVQEAL